MNINTTCFFTGHRQIPVRLASRLATETEQCCKMLIENCGVTDFIAGGALGFDTLAAYSVIRLRKLYPNIKLHLYLPCRDQTQLWNDNDVSTWEHILNLADSYKYITDGRYTSGCMQKRNRAMVDDALYGIAFCSRRSGGAYMTVKYAQDLGRKLIILPKKDGSF